jgi:hypothetical protein
MLVEPVRTEDAPDRLAAELRQSIWPHLLFAACLLYALGVLSIGWNHTLLDDHGFRQTQTAISVYYLVGQGPRLAYQTPVLGPPWALPFEFPFYQWIVASLVGTLRSPLEQTGRAVSVAFFLLSLFPAWRILFRLGLSPASRSMALSLWLVSPFYLFWSRTFLIESTALFLGLTYLATSMAYRDSNRRTALFGCLIAGALAALVKITTFGVFAIAIFLVWSAAIRARRRILVLLLLVGLPAACGLAWTRFADGCKELNPLGQYMTSAALHEWNFGTLAQRCSVETWFVILGRGNLIVGHLALLGLGTIGLIVARRRRTGFAACVLLAMSAPLVFTNLHYVHEYYAYANGVFWIAAMGLCLAAMLECHGLVRRSAYYLLAAVIATSVLQYRQYYYPVQAANATAIADLGEKLQRLTNSNDVLLIVGCDWSPEIPFYSRRRALMVPVWKRDVLQDLEQSRSNLRAYRIGALVVNKRPAYEVDPALLRRLVDRYGWQGPSQHSDEHYDIYLPPAYAVSTDARR